MIGWSNKSDHEIIQQKWPESLQELDQALAEIVEQIRMSPPPDHNSQEPDEAFQEIPSQTNSSIRSSQDDALPPAPFNPFTAPKEPLDPIQPRLRRLFIAFIPILKLARIFYRRVMKTPSSRPAFTLHEELNSHDVERLNREVLSLARSILLVRNMLQCLNVHEEPEIYLQRLRMFANAPAEVLYCCMVSIASFFAPSASLVERNPSENTFKVLFYELKSDFYVATEEFQNLVNRLEPRNYLDYWYNFSPS
jgi:hypothetical protein